MQVFVGFFCYLTSSFCYRTFEGSPLRTFTRLGFRRAQLLGQGEQT